MLVFQYIQYVDFLSPPSGNEKNHTETSGYHQYPKSRAITQHPLSRIEWILPELHNKSLLRTTEPSTTKISVMTLLVLQRCLYFISSRSLSSSQVIGWVRKMTPSGSDPLKWKTMDSTPVYWGNLNTNLHIQLFRTPLWPVVDTVMSQPCRKVIGLRNNQHPLRRQSLRLFPVLLDAMLITLWEYRMNADPLPRCRRSKNTKWNTDFLIFELLVAAFLFSKTKYTEKGFKQHANKIFLALIWHAAVLLVLLRYCWFQHTGATLE